MPAQIGSHWVTKKGLWEYRVPTLIETSVWDRDGRRRERVERGKAVSWLEANCGGTPSTWVVSAYLDANRVERGVFYFHHQAHAEAFEERFGIKPEAPSRVRTVRAPRPQQSRAVRRNGY